MSRAGGHGSTFLDLLLKSQGGEETKETGRAQAGMGDAEARSVESQNKPSATDLLMLLPRGLERCDSTLSDVLPSVPSPKLDASSGHHGLLHPSDELISPVLISSMPALGSTPSLREDASSTVADANSQGCDRAWSEDYNRRHSTPAISSEGLDRADSSDPKRRSYSLVMAQEPSHETWTLLAVRAAAASQDKQTEVPAGHPQVQGEDFTCPFMLLQAAIEANPDMGGGGMSSSGKRKLSTTSPLSKSVMSSPAFSIPDSLGSLGDRGIERVAHHVMKRVDSPKRSLEAPPTTKGVESTAMDLASPSIPCEEVAKDSRLNKAKLRAKKSASDVKSQDQDARNALAALSCPMTGFNKRRGSSGNLSVSSAGTSIASGSNGVRQKGQRASSSSRKKNTSAPPSQVISRHSRTSAASSHRTRRVNRLGQFSIYEASNYEPIIRSSWQNMCNLATREQIGISFYSKFFESNPSLHSLFTRTQDVMGAKFADILSDIVGAVEDVTLMKNKLKALAPMHLRVGVKPEYSVVMGKALFATFQGVLREDWTSEVRAAWEWLWSWLSQLLHQSLEDAMNEATVLTYSWDLAIDNHSEEEMGHLLYDTLFDLAPNLRAVYDKPRQILSSKFVEMMATLVSFHGDSMRVEEQITWLGFRHIKYGAQPQHVRVMGDVLVETMSRAVGDDWTPDMAEAWHELWTKCCSMMMKTIKEANLHGNTVQGLWNEVSVKTTKVKFGVTLRKLLLAGTEWVSSLSHGILESSHNNGKAPSELSTTASIELPTSYLEQIGDTKGKGKGKGKKNIDEIANIFQVEDDLGKGSNNNKVNVSESDALGQYFWEFLTHLLELLWEPEKQNEVLIVMTTRLFHWGIRISHLELIGKALGHSMQKLTMQEWSQESNDAWQWWWKMTAAGMMKTLNVCEQQHAKIIRSSWELCKTLKRPEELGHLWFKELARIAPHVLHLFKRPKKIQTAQFMAVVDMLVTFVEDPALFFDGFKQLTIRHIKYGVKADYAKAFGKSILITVEKTLMEKYDEIVLEAWTILWTRASSCVARALNVGTNPVIVSLVDGDLENLQQAMNCSSRFERFDWLTRVDVNGEILSPLYWSLRDGNFQIARFIMTDLLLIRADREEYYYGREVLFERHPDIVAVLCRDAPHLLGDALFDGLMWHSKDVDNSTIRVNYYIRELFGNPEREPDVWKQALAVLAASGNPEMFEHPVATKLLEVKWTRSGQYYFMAVQTVFALLLIMFMVGNIEYQHDCRFNGLRTFLGVVSFLLAGAQTALAAHHWRMGWTVTSNIKFSPVQIRLPRLLSQFWNICRFVATWLLWFGTFFGSCTVSADGQEMLGYDIRGTTASVQLDSQQFHNFEYVGKAINSFVGVMLWLQLLQTLVMSTRLAALTFKLGFMFEDVGRLLIVVGIFTLAFAAALTCLDEEHFQTFGASATVLTRIVLGAQPPSMIDLGSLALFFVFMFVIVVVLGMLNILIAQLWSTYAKIAENKKGLAMMHRAEICIHMESLLPKSWRQKAYDEMGFEERVPFSMGDWGPSGGIQQIEPAYVRNNKYYKPDRIQRYTGEANVRDPWPVSSNIDDLGGWGDNRGNDDDLV